MPRVDPRDLVAQGEPETVVLLPNGEVLIGLHIRGVKGGHAMLGIREDEFRRPVSCSVTNELYIDTTASKMRMDLLSNPRRVVGDTDTP